MLGTQAKGLGVQGAYSATIGDQTAGTTMNFNAQNAQVAGASFNVATWVLVAIAVIWFLWGVVLHHTKMRETLAPANVAHNIHNLISIGLMAAVFIVAMKILWTKATAWGVPGAAAVANFFQAV